MTAGEKKRSDFMVVRSRKQGFQKRETFPSPFCLFGDRVFECGFGWRPQFEDGRLTPLETARAARNSAGTSRKPRPAGDLCHGKAHQVWHTLRCEKSLMCKLTVSGASAAATVSDAFARAE